MLWEYLILSMPRRMVPCTTRQQIRHIILNPSCPCPCSTPIYTFGTSGQRSVHTLGLETSMEIMEKLCTSTRVVRGMVQDWNYHPSVYLVVRRRFRTRELGEMGCGWWGHTLAPPGGQRGRAHHSPFHPFLFRNCIFFHHFSCMSQGLELARRETAFSMFSWNY